MRYSLLFLSLLALGTAKAQPVLTANTNPAIGAYYRTKTAASTPSPGTGGAGVTWDFSTATSGSPDVNLVYQSCPGAPHCATFPGSTYAASDGGGTYSYWIAESTRLAMNGVYASATTQFVYSDPEEFLRYPFTYNDTYNDSFACSYLSGTYTMNRRGRITVLADGYGTLVLPQGTFSNVLRVKTTEDYEDEMPGTTHIYSSVSYFWYSPAERDFLAKHTSITMNGNPGASTFAYSDRWATGVADVQDLSASLQAFPNPAGDMLHLRFATTGATDVSIILTDLLGRAVRTHVQAYPAGQQEMQLQTTGLPSGLYLVHIDADGQTATRKVAIK